MHLFLLTLFSLAVSASASVISLTINHPQAKMPISKNPAHALSSWSYVDCGAEDDALLINSINIFPDPAPGKKITISASFDVTKVIQDGAYVVVTVKLGLIKLLQKQYDICEELENGSGKDVGIKCPIQKGSYEISQTVKLPQEIPRGKFSVQTRAYTAEEENMLCTDLFVDFLSQRLGIGRVRL